MGSHACKLSERNENDGVPDLFLDLVQGPELGGESDHVGTDHPLAGYDVGAAWLWGG